MKTLDEVIKAFEICDETVTANCPDCPYDIDCENVPGEDLRADALHYLKTYRENQHAYEEGNRKAEEARERYMEAVKNCELAENKYKRLCEETPQNFADTSQKITCPKCHSEFLILPEANNPLTWDGLRQMEGKPVWVEGEHGCIWDQKSWVLIRLDNENEDLIICVATNNGHSEFAIGKEDYGKDWQAYRKERDA